MCETERERERERTVDNEGQGVKEREEEGGRKKTIDNVEIVNYERGGERERESAGQWWTKSEREREIEWWHR